MKSLGKLTQIISVVFCMLFLAACTTAAVDDSLTPTPQATIQPTTQEASQPTTETALVDGTSTTAAENVANSQVQTQAQTETTNQEVASLTPPVDNSKAMTFLPFEGAPASKAGSFTRFLNSSAQSNGLSVLPATRAGATYKVKGYFSALSDGTGTLLVYVWDIVDGTGKRLHRINGRERSGITRTDPWQAITDREIERVAADTTKRLKAWVETR